MAAADTAGWRDLHATCVALAARGVLLVGPAGSGKSALALRLLGAGFWLVADDLVRVCRRDGHLVATAPPSAAGRGLLEARGLGIFRLPGPSAVRLVARLDLDGRAEAERLPGPRSDELLGITLPLDRIDPTRPDAADRVRLVVLAGREA